MQIDGRIVVQADFTGCRDTSINKRPFVQAQAKFHGSHDLKTDVLKVAVARLH